MALVAGLSATLTATAFLGILFGRIRLLAASGAVARGRLVRVPRVLAQLLGQLDHLAQQQRNLCLKLQDALVTLGQLVLESSYARCGVHACGRSHKGSGGPALFWGFSGGLNTYLALSALLPTVRRRMRQPVADWKLAGLARHGFQEGGLKCVRA